jgi:hypothetical protein
MPHGHAIRVRGIPDRPLLWVVYAVALNLRSNFYAARIQGRGKHAGSMETRAMLDLILFLVGLGFFGLLAAYTAGCERV